MMITITAATMYNVVAPPLGPGVEVTEGLIEADVVGDADVEGEAVGEGVADVDGDPVGVGDTEAEVVGDGETLVLGVGVGPVEVVGVGEVDVVVGLGDVLLGDGEGAAVTVISL